MTNGFYDTSIFETSNGKKSILKEFIQDALYLSYNSVCQNKHGSSRVVDKSLNPTIMLERALVDYKARFDVIDRFIYNRGEIPKEQCEYEIVLHLTDWTFFYIFVNEDSFNTLVKKYNLKLKEW